MTRLKEIRNRFAITQDQMARYLGLTRTFVAHLEFTNSAVPAKQDERLLELEALYELHTAEIQVDAQYQERRVKEVKEKFERLIRTNTRLLVKHQNERTKLETQYRMLLIHIQVTNVLIQRTQSVDILKKGLETIMLILQKKFRVCGPEARLLLTFRIESLALEIGRAQDVLVNLPAAGG